MAGERPTRRRPVRTGLKWLAFGVGGLVALLVLALMGARIFLTEGRVARLAERLLDDNLAGDFRIGGFEWAPFPVGVRVTDVAISDPEGEQVLSAKSLQARAGLLPLLSGRLSIPVVEADGVEVLLEDEGDGYGLLAALAPARPSPEKPPSEGGLTIDVGRVDARGLDVRLRQPGLSVDLDAGYLDGGEALLQPDGMQASAQAIGAARIAIRVDGRDLGVAPISLTGVDFHQTAEGTGVEVEQAELEVGGSHLALHGRLDGLGPDETPRVAGAGNLTLRLDDPTLRAWFPEVVARDLDPTGVLRIAFEADGPLSIPAARVEASGTDLRLAGLPVSQLRVEAALDEQALTVQRLDLAAVDGVLSARGRLKFAGRVPAWEASVEAKALPVQALGGAFVDPAWLPDRVTGTVDLAGRGLAEPQGEIGLDLVVEGRPPGLPASVPFPLDVTGHAEVAGDHLQISGIEVRGDGALVSVTGRVPLGSGALDARLTLTHEQPGEALAALDVPAGARSIRLEAHLGGTLTLPEAQGRLDVRGLSYPPSPPMQVTAPFRFTEGTLFLDGAGVVAAGGRAVLDGRIRLLTPAGAPLEVPWVDLRVSAQGLEVAGLTGDWVGGGLYADGRVRGPVDRLGGDAAVRLSPARIGDAELTAAEGRVSLEGGAVVLDALTLRPVGGGTVSATGRLRLEDLGVEAEASGQGLPVETLARMGRTEVPASGRVGFDAQVSGTVAEPQWTLDARVADLAAEGSALGTLEAQASGTLQQVEGRLSLEGAVGSAQVTGTFSVPDAVVAGRLAIQRLDLSTLPLPRPDEQAPPPVGGVLVADLQVEGSLPVPDVHGELKVSDLALEGRPVGGGPVTVQVAPLPDDGGLEVKALLADMGQARAVVRRGPPLSVEATGRLVDLRLRRLVPVLDEYDTGVVLSGDLGVDWRQDAPEALEARVRLDALSVSLSDARLQATRPVVARYANQTLVLEDLSLEGPDGSFHAEGRAGDTLDFTAKGRLQMALLPPFVPPIARASGAIDVDLRATGTPADPQVRGELALAGPVSLRPRTAVREVRLESGRIRLQPGRVDLERLRGEADGGLFTVQGYVDLDGFTPARYEVDLSGQNLPLRTPDLVLDVNTDLKVTGRSLEMLVAGRVDIVSGRYLQKFELKNFNFVAQRKEVQEPLERRFPFLRGIRLDLAASSSGGMDVDIDAGAFGLALSLDVDLKATGTAAEPVVDGRVSADRGKITFPAAPLEVSQAMVDFSPTLGGGINPQVDLRAEGEITPTSVSQWGVETTYFVTMVLEGNVDEMVLDLNSDPSLDRLEVLSLLVSGRVNPFESTGQSSAKADAALAFAGTQLATPLTRFVADGLESLLNLQLQLGTEVTTESITVTASKDLSRRLRLEGAYQRGFGDTQTIGLIRARLLLSDRVFLEGTTESVTGTTTTQSALREGSRTDLELKLRVFGD